MGENVGVKDLPGHISVKQFGVDIGDVPVIGKKKVEFSSGEGLQGSVVFRLLSKILFDIPPSTSIKENEVRIPREDFFLVDEEMTLGSDLLGEIPGPDPIQGEIAGIRALDALGSPVSDPSDIYPGLRPFIVVSSSIQEILPAALDKGDDLLRPAQRKVFRKGLAKLGGGKLIAPLGIF